ncbi:hypothetical protein SDC9_144965 [bioreactor metagenome]|uniref:Uncharacterized protein n=1 Tax=bioreactor metagenome TaxID=1076179 RepID=A0A645E9I1_9ZZZZ
MLAAIGNRRQVWGIGLDQQTIERAFLCNILDGLRILERDDARKGKMKPEVQRLGCHRPVFRKAVHHPAHRIGTFFRHQTQGIDRRIAGMHHQRLPARPRSADVVPETLALPLRLILVPIVIQPGFTDTNHLGMGGQCNEALNRRLLDLGRFRMNANRRIQIGLTLGERQHFRKIFQIDADADSSGNPILAHTLQNFGQPPGQVGKIQVAVRIDQHAVDQSVCVGREDCMTPPSKPSILRRASWPLSSLLK